MLWGDALLPLPIRLAGCGPCRAGFRIGAPDVETPRCRISAIRRPKNSQHRPLRAWDGRILAGQRRSRHSRLDRAEPSTPSPRRTGWPPPARHRGVTASGLARDRKVVLATVIPAVMISSKACQRNDTLQALPDRRISARPVGQPNAAASIAKDACVQAPSRPRSFE